MPLPSFPLLVKELSEQAARKRTYVLRSAYALGLLLVFTLMHSALARNTGDARLGLIGFGSELFDDLFRCEYWAVLLLMPALSAGALTSEKEQGSLTILMLTDLGPWELLLQKWWSRLLAVGSFLLIGMPLMGLCYAYGGLTVERLALGLFTLLLLCLQTAAVALAVSAWCRGSTAALLATYAALTVMYVGPLLLARVLMALSGHSSRYSYHGQAGAADYDFLWPLRLFVDSQSSLADALVPSAPILGTVLIALLFARWALPRRAQLGGPGVVLVALRRLDALFERGDRALGRAHRPKELPLQAPVAWRELNRRSLANWRYLVRFVVVALIVAVGLLVLVSACDPTWDLITITLQISSLVLLAVALVLALVLGSTVIAAERTQQTLEVLLTTPLTARTILVEKLSGLRRIIFTIVALALLLVVGRERVMETASLDLVAHTAYFIILPALFTWFAVAIGLLLRRANRAVLVALIGGCLWLGSTMIVAATLFGLLKLDQSGPGALLCYFTPGMLPLFTEVGQGAERLLGGLPLMLVVFVAWHGALWLLLRGWCLRHADRLMRRGGGT